MAVHWPSWALKSAGEPNTRPGRNDVSRKPLARSTRPFASGSAGAQITTLAPSTPRNAWQAAVSSLRPRRHRPTAPSPSHTSTRRIRPQVDRPQLPHPLLEHRQRVLPAQPLGDHRRRHLRPGHQQLPDARLDPIHDRPTRRPHVPGWPLAGQRPLDGVLGDPHHPRDRPDRHLLGSVQPADLGPVLHVQHPSSSRLDILEPGLDRERGQLSAAAKGSVFTRRRQAEQSAAGSPGRSAPRSHTTITRQPWRLLPLGAKRALSSTRWTTSSGTGLDLNRRVLPAVRMTWVSSIAEVSHLVA